MKIVDGFVLKTIADTNVVVPVGSNNVSFRGIISLNGSGAFLWNLLTEETDEDSLVKALTTEYDIDEATARADVKEFVDTMRKANLIA
ncbi:MAG: PqqD family protein [Ruminococcaceae bacterium]|nr:PqqD family protein [Oscillospiraceae bacterium]